MSGTGARDGAARGAFDDVRMRGFQHRQTVAAALQWVDRAARMLPSQPVQLGEASGRVLAEPVVSNVDVPAFRRAMMDGFALQAADSTGASAYNPLALQIVGTAMPGVPFEGELQPGQAVQIMTGAPAPAGADAVIPAERIRVEGATVEVLDAVAPQKHIGDVGEDIARGQQVLNTGRRLRAQDLGVLSSLGVDAVPVVSRPQVRLLITGNELCPVGQPATQYQTRDANGPMLTSLIQRDGGQVHHDGITVDEPDSIRAALLDEAADVIIVTGGSSVGIEDHAPRVLAEIGELSIHGVAMRPSSPMGMGRIGDRIVFLLPGNPVSALCGYDHFAGRAIRLLGGRSADWPYPVRSAQLAEKLSSVIGRHDYARVKFDAQGLVQPLAIAGSSILSSTTRADGFVLLPSDSEGLPAGAEVKVYLYDQVGG